MITLTYGTDQRFRYRYQDITLLGRVEAPLPARSATYRLNHGPAVEFYVEPLAEPPGLDWRFQYKRSPARLRLPHLGDFTIEIPVVAPQLKPGPNRLTIQVIDGAGQPHHLEATFEWEPTPIPFPLCLRDLSGFRDIQDVGQVVNGAFDLDREHGLIRSRAPAAPDALLLLGSPHGSQEALYDVRFAELHRAKYLGLSDFFVRHEEENPPLGIKPGWSTAGLATLTYGWRPGSPRETLPLDSQEVLHAASSGPHMGEARAWISFGDNSNQARRWLVKTQEPARVPIESGVWHRVRQQLFLRKDVNHVRFRLWRADDAEPSGWLCDVSDSRVDPTLPRFRTASFALFQHTGMSTEWSNLHLSALDY
jgi:hypothetical protein